MPAYREVTETPYGVIIRETSGYVHVAATGDELYKWAHPAGNVKPSWPSSVLAGLDECKATFAPNGDLVDIEHFGVDDVPADEFNAWVEDLKNWQPYGFCDVETITLEEAAKRIENSEDDNDD